MPTMVLLLMPLMPTGEETVKSPFVPSRMIIWLFLMALAMLFLSSPPVAFSVTVFGEATALPPFVV